MAAVGPAFLHSNQPHSSDDCVTMSGELGCKRAYRVIVEVCCGSMTGNVATWLLVGLQWMKAFVHSGGEMGAPWQLSNAQSQL
jgi:hypothetical protein